MKTPKDLAELTELFKRLPSASDLLEKPQIKSLVERASELDVATGVRQFVDRMRQEVSRRSIDMPIPSVGELAERAARFILGREATDQAPVINATGQLWPAGITGPPLADDAIAAMAAMMHHTHLTAGQAHRTTGQGGAEIAAKAAGAKAARLLTSPTAALLLAIAQQGQQGSLVVARGELGTLDADKQNGGTRITDLAEQAGVALIEVGATDRVTLADYEQALEAGGTLVLRVESLPHALSSQTSRPPLDELNAAVARHSGVLIHDIGRGSLQPLSSSIAVSAPTAAESLAVGSSVVVARGDGYLGGPACGLALGSQEAIDQLAAHRLAPLFALQPPIAAALAATLVLHQQPDQAALAIPTLARLSTPLENLRTRAERLAAQINGQPVTELRDTEERDTEEAVAYEIPAGVDLGNSQPLASHGIRITCQPGKREQLARRLAASRPQLLGSWHDDQLSLDLRTVSPDDDMALVAAFATPHEEPK